MNAIPIQENPVNAGAVRTDDHSRQDDGDVLPQGRMDPARGDEQRTMQGGTSPPSRDSEQRSPPGNDSVAIGCHTAPGLPRTGDEINPAPANNGSFVPTPTSIQSPIEGNKQDTREGGDQDHEIGAKDVVHTDHALGDEGADNNDGTRQEPSNALDTQRDTEDSDDDDDDDGGSDGEIAVKKPGRPPFLGVEGLKIATRTEYIEEWMQGGDRKGLCDRVASEYVRDVAPDAAEVAVQTWELAKKQKAIRDTKKGEQKNIVEDLPTKTTPAGTEFEQSQQANARKEQGLKLISEKIYRWYGRTYGKTKQSKVESSIIQIMENVTKLTKSRPRKPPAANLYFKKHTKEAREEFMKKHGLPSKNIGVYQGWKSEYFKNLPQDVRVKWEKKRDAAYKEELKNYREMDYENDLGPNHYAKALMAHDKVNGPIADALAHWYGMSVIINLVGPTYNSNGKIDVLSVSSVPFSFGGTTRMWAEYDRKGYEAASHSMQRYGETLFPTEQREARTKVSADISMLDGLLTLDDEECLDDCEEEVKGKATERGDEESQSQKAPQKSTKSNKKKSGNEPAIRAGKEPAGTKEAGQRRKASRKTSNRGERVNGSVFDDAGFSDTGSTGIVHDDQALEPSFTDATPVIPSLVSAAPPASARPSGITLDGRNSTPSQNPDYPNHSVPIDGSTALPLTRLGGQSQNPTHPNQSIPVDGSTAVNSNYPDYIAPMGRSTGLPPIPGPQRRTDSHPGATFRPCTPLLGPENNQYQIPHESQHSEPFNPSYASQLLTPRTHLLDSFERHHGRLSPIAERWEGPRMLSPSPTTYRDPNANGYLASGWSMASESTEPYQNLTPGLTPQLGMPTQSFSAAQWSHTAPGDAGGLQPLPHASYPNQDVRMHSNAPNAPPGDAGGLQPLPHASYPNQNVRTHGDHLLQGQPAHTPPVALPEAPPDGSAMSAIVSFIQSGVKMDNDALARLVLEAATQDKNTGKGRKPRTTRGTKKTDPKKAAATKVAAGKRVNKRKTVETVESDSEGDDQVLAAGSSTAKRQRAEDSNGMRRSGREIKLTPGAKMQQEEKERREASKKRRLQSMEPAS